MTQLPAIAALSYLGGCQPEPRWDPAKQLQAVERRLANAHGLQVSWEAVLEPPAAQERLDALRVYLQELRSCVQRHLEARPDTPFLVLGGDHANAIGIWRAVLDHLAPDCRFGLLWIDAHMDCHTFATTPSGNIHGMPLAALMGIEDQRLQHLCPGSRRLRPQNLQLFGVRSFEPEEAQRVDELRIPVTYMDDIHTSGLESRLETAFERLTAECDVYGISIDIDAIDPADAPAVSTPVANGIDAGKLCAALRSQLHRRRPVGVEIAEYYPSLDHNGHTQTVIADLIGVLFER